MRFKFKRIIVLALASVLMLGSSINTLAVNPGAPTTSPGKGGPAGSAGTPQSGWGYHITIASMQDMYSDIPTIPAADINNYNLADLEDDIQLRFHQRYLRPGEGGIVFCTADAMQFPFAPVSSDNYNDIRPVTKYTLQSAAATPPSGRSDVGTVDWNVLGWQIYETVYEPGDRPLKTDDMLVSSDQRYSYNTELATLFSPEGAAAVGDSQAWVDQVQTLYLATGAPTAKEVLLNVITMPSTLHQNVTLFDWSAWAGDFAGASNIERTTWDRIGLVSFCAYLCMLAEPGSIERSDWGNTVYNWVSNGYQGSDMPIIDIQMGAPMALNWSSSGVPSQVVFATTPYVYEHCVPGVSAEMIYSGWGGEKSTVNIHDRIGAAFGLNNCPLDYRGYTAQAFGIVGWNNGVARRNWGNMNQLDRHWCTQLEAIGGTGLQGYYPIYTYPVSGWPEKSPKETIGSFTWDLTPKGLIDKTPAEEISESSTIYNLNVSQNGYNHNNYSSKWEPLVRTDNSDCNQIQIDVYHISQKLPDGTESTVYMRDQVKAGGKPILTPVDKVTAGDGIITNVPSIGTIKAGEKVQVTDDQLLDILKTGTGLTYTETVAGPLVVNDNPEGVRVTYAIYVTVWTACKNRQVFSNEQQWFVEYRSEPGTYIYESDDPQGFAEIKCGYFDRDRGYAEPYEAMAGSPTTENLYFVSGGQEFVAQITYKYIKDKNTIRNYEQKYTTETCPGWYEPWEETFTEEKISTIQTWLNNNTKTAIKGKNESNPCPECGQIHNNTGNLTDANGQSSKEKHVSTSVTGGITGSDEPVPGDYYTEINLTATHWDWKPLKSDHCCVCDDEDCDGCCGGTSGATDSKEGQKCAGDAMESKKNATRYSGTIKFYHTDWNNNAACEKLTSSIKWEQEYANFNYAQAQKVHVWRLEKSRVEGIDQLTLDGNDVLVAEIPEEELSQVIFNVAEKDTALEGRLYYMLHPSDGDNFVFNKKDMKTRGCCHCFNHNAAEDLIASAENPNNLYEAAWVISDYLVLESSNSTHSLLYHEYSSLNSTAASGKSGTWPICRIKVSGTDQASRQDNGYTITTWTGGNQAVTGSDGSTDQETFYGWDKRGQAFRTDIISFNTSAAGGKANDLNGTMEKICENKETFFGGPVSSNNKNSRGLAFGGYNGDYSGTSTDLAAGTNDLEAIDKYSGRKGKNNWQGKKDKKIFKVGYQHQTQGELVAGLTESPQVISDVPDPLMLVWNDIDVHDYDVHNGEKKFKNSSIFYHYIIGYKAGNIYDIDTANDYGIEGFQKKTTYSNGSNNINNIIIHNPVSAQYAKLIALPSDLDQRTDRNPYIDKLNEDSGKCSGKAQSCKYAHINCEYNGSRFHTDDCYAEIRSGGLATTPVTGNITTTMKPVEIGEKTKGSKTFTSSGARQVFQAPATGTYHIELEGAGGAPSSRGGSAGRGGKVYGDVEMTKGQNLYIWVGGQGSGKSGGLNGGGVGAGNGSGYGGGGGGYTRVDLESTLVAVAGGGGGAGGARGNGGNGGYPAGTSGGQQYGSPGSGGNQSRGGTGGRNYGTDGAAWQGGTNTTTAASGGGGGGGGYFGGGGGGNDYSRYKDVDDSGGGGGSSFIGNLLKNSGHQTGTRIGNGQVVVSWEIDDKTTILTPEVSGTLTVGDGATPIGTAYKPQVYQATVSGMYSVHLYGARGGGNEPGKGSAGGLGGHAGGQIYLEAGEKLLVTTGGIGSNGVLNNRTVEYEWVYPSGCYLRGQTYWGATSAGSQCSKHPLEKTGRSRTVGGLASGGYNGGGHGGTTGAGGFGGGGATDVVKEFVNQNANTMRNYQSGGTVTNGKLSLPNSASFYWGPRMNSKAGHIYRVDYFGENLDKAVFDTFAYLPNGTSMTNNASKVHEFITPNYAQIFYRINNPAKTAGQEFRVFGNAGVAITEMWVVDMDDRLLVAAGGGGSDDIAGDAAGVLGGGNDGRGGAGGGNDGENGYRNGASYSGNAGAKASGGYLPGIGGDAQSSDAGGGGAGWYGGYGGQTGNDGGGGGSSNPRKVANGVTEAGQNSGSGYAIIILPGKGDVPVTYQLSCSEPHHAMNLNYHKMIAGWQHEGGYICDGEKCAICAEGGTLYSPTGFAFDKQKLTQAYIIKHNGEWHLTHGNDTHCDQCDTDVTFDKYTLDDKTYRDCCFKATSYNTAAFDTRGAQSAKFHYAFGDDDCYDPCNDDEKHKKKKTDEYETTGGKEAAGQFVILDYDFEAYFPNIGDFYGNGALGIPNTQYPEGLGYIDNMDTTIWLKEKYALFPFDVTYNGHTFLAGEKVMLGWYDESEHIWHDDRPDDYRYTFHCLMNNLEAACVSIKFVAVAKNTPLVTIESVGEDHNYTRYTSNKRAYHDAYKGYVIDVLGRIGVLSIEDTGDFRFSNYYKQTIDGWRVNQVVREVDLGKQNFVSVDQKTIFNDPVSDATKGQNTWGIMDWMEPVDKLRAFPLTPGENNVKALKNQAHRIGYMDYMSLVTLGNYWGENVNTYDMYKIQIQPYYYYYNLETKEWTPVDVYVKTGNTYKIINDYGTTESTTESKDGYLFHYDLNWEDEYKRRMYTTEERNATENVSNNKSIAYDPNSDHQYPVRIPMGMRWLHGTANMLFLRDGNRTFIGSRYRYGVNTEQDGRIPEVEFQRQGQRYNFTLGLPTQSAFVQKDEPCTPENIAKYDMDKGIIVVALDIIAKGTVWTLQYDGTPVSDRVFDLFNDGTQMVSWKNAGPNGPEDKIVVLVYTDAKTSRNDLTTEGTH